MFQRLPVDDVAQNVYPILDRDATSGVEGMWRLPVTRLHDCKQHGHRFEARYDESPRPVKFDNAPSDLDRVRELTITRSYVKDICVRCGAEVQREVSK